MHQYPILSNINSDFKNSNIIWNQYNVIHPPSSNEFNTIRPDFRSLTPIFPKNIASNPHKIPLAVLVSPGSCGEVPLMDYRGKYHPFCTMCGAFFSIFNKVDEITRTTYCPVCGNTLTLPSDLDFRTSIEFTQPVYEFIMDHQKESRPVPPNNFLIIIDVSGPAIKSGFTKCFSESLLSNLHLLSDRTHLCIMTCSDELVIYDSQKQRSYSIGDLDDIVCPLIAFRELEENREYFIETLSQISLMTEHHSTSNCFGCALEIAVTILEPYAGNIIAGINGLPGIGSHKLVQQKAVIDDCQILNKTPSGEEVFYVNIGRKMNSLSISLTLFASSNGHESFSLIAIPCGLTSGAFNHYYQFNPEKNGNHLFLDIQSSFTKKYFYGATAELVATPVFMHYNGISSNGINISSNIVKLSNFSSSSSILFEFSQYAQNQRPFVGFQFRLKYTADDNTLRARVMTTWFTVSENPSIISQYLDYGVYLSYLMRTLANSQLGSSYSNAIQQIKSQSNQLNENIINLIIDSLIGHSSHPHGPDGKVSDIISIRSYDPFEASLYISSRYSLIGPNQKCVAFQTLYSIVLYIYIDCDNNWLQKAFGVDSLVELPNSLPTLNTPENCELWDFIKSSPKKTQILIQHQ